MDSLDSGFRKRALVVAPYFSSVINSNPPLSDACALSELAAVDVLTTDFDHWSKTTREHVQVPPIERIIYLKSMPYRSNISLGRLISHLLFSLKAVRFFLRHRDKYDIVYVTLPFNILGWFILKYSGGKHKIIEVIDIWPDALPFPPRFVQLFRPAFIIWRKFFDRAVEKADVMMAVSDSYFQETIQFVSPHCKSRRFYIGEVNLRADVTKESILTIAYVGNIGHLYDFETLLGAMTNVKQGFVQLFIVGEGDRRDWLLNELRKRDLRYEYFGQVYDQAKLAGILSRAHVGFNGYMNTTAAFSTKASTYFAAGLPILNSMKGDLRELVATKGLGFNYTGGDCASLKVCLSQLNKNDLIAISQNCTSFFAAELERGKVRRNMVAFLRECLE